MPNPSDLRAPGLEPVATRVGDVGVGPAALVDAGGRVAPVSSAGRDWSVQWWIGSEDRWHIPTFEATCRQRLVESMPVVETTIKVPGGDASARCYGAVLAGSDRRGVVIDVTNASAIPFAVAFTVVSREPMTTDGSTVWIAGVAVLRLAKAAARFGHGTDVEALRCELDAERFVERPESAVTGVLALIVPLPHTASTIAVLDTRAPVRSRRRGATEPVGGPLDRATVPSSDQVVAGWAAFVQQGTRLDLADRALTASFDAARADLLMGPEPTADAADIAAIATATARLGRLGEMGELISVLVDCQKLDGRIDSAEPLEATSRFLAAVGALWSAGVGAEQVEALIGPVAKAGHWLGHGRRRPSFGSGAASSSAVARSLESVVPALMAIGQPDVAGEFVQVAASFAANHSDPSERDIRPVVSAVRRSADLVVDRLDAGVAETSDGLDLFATWLPTAAGRPLEVHEVRTRWGLASCALRWHGERPALLWELVAYPNRAIAVGEHPRWTTTALDPGWSSTELEGEALLAAPRIPDFS